MYIVFADGAGVVHQFRVSDLSIDSDQIFVRLRNIRPGSMSDFQQAIQVPLMPLSTTPLRDVAEWLVSEQGTLAGGIIAEEGELEFIALQMSMLMKLKAMRDSLRDGTAPTPFGLVNTDMVARDNLFAVDRLLQLASKHGQPLNSVLFTMADDQDVELTSDEFEQMMLAIGVHGFAVHRRKRELQAEIQAAQTLAQLEAIDLEVGWPQSVSGGT